MGDLAKALAILLKYDPFGDICAEHDVIYMAHDVGPDSVSAEDIEALKTLGVEHDDDPGGWRMFV